MVAARLTCALAVALLATPAPGSERSARFAVTVQVVAPLSVSVAGVATARREASRAAVGAGSWTAHLPAAASLRGGLPAALVSAGPSAPALPCGAASECRATFRTDPARGDGADVVVTVLPDGAPAAIVELTRG